jgi:hypothetical protein
MRFLVNSLKVAGLGVLGAAVMAAIGFFVGAIIANVAVAGRNPHTDGLDRLGIALTSTIVGAGLGLLGGVVLGLRSVINRSCSPLESTE